MRPYTPALHPAHSRVCVPTRSTLFANNSVPVAPISHATTCSFSANDGSASNAALSFHEVLGLTTPFCPLGRHCRLGRNPQSLSPDHVHCRLRQETTPFTIVKSLVTGPRTPYRPPFPLVVSTLTFRRIQKWSTPLTLRYRPRSRPVYSHDRCSGNPS